MSPPLHPGSGCSLKNIRAGRSSSRRFGDLLRCKMTVCLPGESLTGGIMQMAGLDEWLLAIDKIDAAALTTLLEKLWKQRRQIREQIRTRIPAFIAQAELAGKLTAGDYERLRKEHQL